MRQRGIHYDDWPPRDRSLFDLGRTRGSRRTHKRSPRTLAPDTIKGIILDYSASIGWLNDTGAFNIDVTPVARWPTVIVEAMIRDMADAGYSTASQHSRAGRLKRALNIMEPTADLSHFDEILREMDRPQPAFNPVVWRVTACDLQQFGIEFMHTAETSPDMPELVCADMYRSGLQIALIAARPWRKRVFTKIELWKNLSMESGIWRMEAGASETKQRRYQSGEIPAKITQNLERYLAHFRRILCGDGYDGPAVWINKFGLPQTPSQFYCGFCQLTEERFGDRITPQLVRKIAATTMAVHNPKEVHAIQGILGHGGLAVGEQYYNLANSISAFDQLDETIDQVARDAKKRQLRKNK